MMNEIDLNGPENLKSSDEHTKMIEQLKEENRTLTEQIQRLSNQITFQNEGAYRQILLEFIAQTGERLQAINESFGLISKEIRNNTKVLAAAHNISIQ